MSSSSFDTNATIKAHDGTDFPWTPPIDPRFPNANISRYCFQMYFDYQRCTRLMGTSYSGCTYFKKAYTALCPNAWIAKWEEQIKNGTFSRDLPPDNC